MSFTVRISNELHKNLIDARVHIVHGKVIRLPSVFYAGKSNMAIFEKDSWALYGCEGTLEMTVESTNATLLIDYENPYSGTSSYTIRMEGNLDPPHERRTEQAVSLTTKGGPFSHVFGCYLVTGDFSEPRSSNSVLDLVISMNED